MAEVGDWLRSIAPAYAQYCAAFAENGVNGITALGLYHEELKLLGVMNAVHQRRLTNDIALYRSSSASSSGVAPSTQTSSTPKGEWERDRLCAALHCSITV